MGGGASGRSTAPGALAALVLLLAAGCSRSPAKVDASDAPGDPLYVRCAGKLAVHVTDAGVQRLPCEGGELEVGLLGANAQKDVVLSYTPRGNAGLGAANLRTFVQTVFPNLGAPSLTRAAPCRHVVPLSVDRTASPATQLATAATIYNVAERLVRQYERAGGSRYAEWNVNGMLLTAQSMVQGDDLGGKPYAMLTLHVAGTAVPSDRPVGNDVPWASTPTCVRSDSPHLAALRTRLLARGWWFDDADAFMDAAKAVGQPDSPETAQHVAVVAALVRQAQDWGAPGQLTVSDSCLAPKVMGAGKGLFAPFDTLSGVDKDFGAVIAPRARRLADGTFASPDEVELEVRRFKALIGTPEHARCALTELRETQNASNWLQAFNLGGFFKREDVSQEMWTGAKSLLLNARFASELQRALARRRADLVVWPPGGATPVLGGIEAGLVVEAEGGLPAAPGHGSARTGADAGGSALAPNDEGFVDVRGGAGWGDRCWTHLKARKFDWARAACERGLAMAPATPQPKASLLFNTGLALKGLGDNVAARSYFEQSLALRENPMVRGELDALPK